MSTELYIIVDKGHSFGSPGASGLYSPREPNSSGRRSRENLTEYTVAERFGNALINALRAKFRNVDETPRRYYLAQRLEEAVTDRFPPVDYPFLPVNYPDIAVAFISVHLNSAYAGSGGTEVFYSVENPKSWYLASVLLEQVVACAKGFAKDGRWGNRGVKNENQHSNPAALGLIQWRGVPIGKDVYSGRAERAGMSAAFYQSCFHAVLVEVGFMDSAHDMDVMGQPFFADALGSAMANGVEVWARALGVKPSPPPSPRTATMRKISELYK